MKLLLKTVIIYPTFRATLYPEVTELFCRLSLFTLFQSQRLFTLETWCGYEYDLNTDTLKKSVASGFSRTKQYALDISEGETLCQSTSTPSQLNTIRGSKVLLIRKDNSSQDTEWCLQTWMMGCPSCQMIRRRNINPLPFRYMGNTKVCKPKVTLFPKINKVNLYLRIGSLMYKRSSHETFLHFGFQGFHLNNCYYYQDLQ